MKHPANKKVDKSEVTERATEHLDHALKGLLTIYVVKMETGNTFS